MIFTMGNLLTLGVVLVALILYRQLDRSNRSLDKVRKYGERLKDDLAVFVAEKESAVKDYAIELDVQQKAAKELLKRLVSTEEGLAARNEAVTKIDERIHAYDSSLDELMRMTARAQENLERLRDESTFTDSLVKRVKEAKEQLAHMEKSLGDLGVRFERDNTESLERVAEAMTAATRSTVSDLQATAETIERRVEDHRDAVAKIDREREASLAKDSATLRSVFEEAFSRARAEADRLEDAAFAKLKEQAIERSHRFQTAVEEKLAQFQEASKTRLAEVQALVKSMKDDWKKDAAEMEERKRSFRDEWKKDAAELAAIAKAEREEWKKDSTEIHASLKEVRAAVASEGKALVTEAAENAATVAREATEETASVVAGLRADLEREAADLGADLERETASLRADLERETTALRAEHERDAGALHAELERDTAELRVAVTREAAEAVAEAEAARTASRAEFGAAAEALKGGLAAVREETLHLEQASAARSAAVEAKVAQLEGDFKRRSAALEDAVVRAEAQALASAGEDAARRQGEIRAAVETSVLSITDRLVAESRKLDSQAGALEAKSSELAARMEAFLSETGSRLAASAEEAERRALEKTEIRLESYRNAASARFERLEALADDVARMDVELRRSMAETENRVRDDFSLFEKEAEASRAAAAAEFSASAKGLKADMEGVERELAALKSRAYENVSEKLKLFEDDFFADLSKRSDEIDRRLAEWKGGLEASLEKLADEAAEARGRVEAAYAEDLRAKLSEQSERAAADLERLKAQTGAFEEGIRDQMAQADQSLGALKDQLSRDLEEARTAAAAAAKAEIGRHALETAEALKKEQREIEGSLKALADSVELRRSDISERLDASRREMEAWQAKVAQQLREADATVDEARRRSRELATESDERLASVRGAIQEARDDADARRAELFGRAEEQARAIDSSVKDVDRRIKEFVAQTKLFERADELKAELSRRIEDLGSDLDRLDQRRSEAAELEAQFVKIKRLEDEVNAKMTRFLSEKRRVELMEADFKRLLQTAQSVDEKLAQVTASDDVLQGLQAQLRRLEDAVADAEEKYKRVEAKNAILDATSDGIDRNFQALREAEAQAKRFDEELKRHADGLTSVRVSIEKLSADKEKADEVASKLGNLDSALAAIEERAENLLKAREWLARTETRLEEVSKQAQDQVKLMGSLLKAEGQKGQSKDRGAPPVGVRETVVKLAHQGWSIDEIARAVKLSKGEVELILEISPKG